MKKIIYTLFFAAVLLTSCEDAIEYELQNGTDQVAIDAFINNLDTAQVITIKKSKSFFNENDQVNVVGASVKVTDDKGNNYTFVDKGNGKYVWDDTVLVHLNRSYTLNIDYDGVNYKATSFSNPVPPLDSITYTYVEAADFGNAKSGYFIEFWATDNPGRLDYYWIKTFRNGKFDNRVQGINTAIDGTPGGGGDGLPFIFPNRFVFVNNQQDPFQENDIARVEIWAMEKDGVTFFQEISAQTGNTGLFATPPSNVRTNITANTTEVAKKAIGFFAASMVSVKEQKMIKK